MDTSKNSYFTKLVFFILLAFRDALTCKSTVCFTWKRVGEFIVFSCTVPNVVYRISIVDPMGFTKAHCIPALTCKSVNENGVMLASLTSELVLKLHVHGGKSNNALNGIWSCHHGSTRGTANTTVSLIGTNEYTSTDESFTGEIKDKTTLDWQGILEYTSTEESFTGEIKDKTTLNWQGILEFNSSPKHLSTTQIAENTTQDPIEHVLSTYFVPLVAVVMIVFAVLALCNIFVSRQCSLYNVNHNNGQTRKVIQPSVITDDIILRQSENKYRDEYEYINEENMIENKKKTQHVVNLETRQNNLDSNHRLSSTSENSYLEVIDGTDCTNSYECIVLKPIDNCGYNYCGILNQNSDTHQHDFFAFSHSKAQNLRTTPVKKSKSINDWQELSSIQLESEMLSNSCPELYAENKDDVYLLDENLEIQQQKDTSTDILRSVL